MPTNQARAHPPTIHAALAEKLCQPDALLEHVDEGADIIVGMFNSEPQTVLDALESNAERISGVRIHQMFPSRERDYMHGAFPGLRHVSWFLSPANREAFRNDTCDLIPNNFSDVPALMRRATRRSLVLAAVSPPDRHGYFSLGTHADYVAAPIGEAPFFVEMNPSARPNLWAASTDRLLVASLTSRVGRFSPSRASTLSCCTRQPRTSRSPASWRSFIPARRSPRSRT
jgi:acyl-CoA hydrolase